MLELINISKSFDEKKIINNLSYNFKDEKITAILGESGGGKTTLLRCIAEIIKPDSGEIVNDYKKISCAFQEHRLLPWLTVSQNVNLVLEKEPMEDAQIKKLLDKFELSNIENNFPDELSGGMKQRVSLARAFAHNGDLLLLDEPFSELDEQTSSHIIDYIKKNKGSKTVIVVTHSMRDAQKLADEIITFNSSPLCNSCMNVENINI